jgi:uncharacterized MAPEG superfamily protein
MTTNIAMLVLSLALLLLFQLIQAAQLNSVAGVSYNLSARDKPVDVGLMGGRIQRAKVNLIENLLLFAPLSILAEVTHANPQTVGWGAIIFFVARVVHAITYLAGVAVIRTLAWFAGVIGCVILALAVLGWA